jgi:hypothetical protein
MGDMGFEGDDGGFDGGADIDVGGDVSGGEVADVGGMDVGEGDAGIDIDVGGTAPDVDDAPADADGGGPSPEVDDVPLETADAPDAGVDQVPADDGFDVGDPAAEDGLDAGGEAPLAGDVPDDGFEDPPIDDLPPDAGIEDPPVDDAPVSPSETVPPADVPESPWDVSEAPTSVDVGAPVPDSPEPAAEVETIELETGSSEYDQPGQEQEEAAMLGGELPPYLDPETLPNPETKPELPPQPPPSSNDDSQITDTPPDPSDDSQVTDDQTGQAAEDSQYTEVIEDGYGKAVKDKLTGGIYDLDQQEALEKEGAHIAAWAAESGDDGGDVQSDASGGSPPPPGGTPSGGSPPGGSSPPPDGSDGQYTEVIEDGYGKAVKDKLTGGIYDLDQQEALEKEGAQITAWAEETGDPEAYREDVTERMYSPSDAPEPEAGALLTLESSGGATDDDSPSTLHAVPSTTLERIDTAIDEGKARAIAEREYPNTPVESLADNNLKGVTYEGMTQRHLEEKYGKDRVVVHPEGLTLRDGRRIKPDFGVKDDQDRLTKIYDAKGYARKETTNPRASASTLTHMQNVKEAGKYTEVDSPSVESVTFIMPNETARMEAVQNAVSDLGTADRRVAMEGVGTEAEMKQRMSDLRSASGESTSLSPEVRSEIHRIQDLPVAERRQAMGEFVQSLRDEKGDETRDGRNLRWSTQVERNGDGVTIIDPSTGEKYTVWYTE